MPWMDFLKPAAMLAAGYFDYKDRDNRRDQLNEAREAQHAAQMAAWTASQNRGGGGGRNTGGAKKALQEGHAQSLALLQPYIDQANKTLPIISDAFNKGVEGFAPLSNKVLSDEYINSLLTYSPPPAMKLPDHLVGSKK